MEETREWKAFDVLRQKPQTSPPDRGRRAPRRGRGCGCGCLSVLLLLLLIAAGAIAAYLGLFRHDLVPGKNNSDKIDPVLILGIDREAKDQPGRSDTIILSFVNTGGKRVSLLSIPRDTYADIPVRGKKDKINAAYATGGSAAAVETVGLLLDREIKYYLTTDLEGFVSIVDTLGGITVTVDEEVAEGIGVPPGVQRLKGEEALKFVRYRGYPTADIGRIKHQQIFLKAVVDEAMRLRNIWKLPLLIGDLRSAVDTNLSTAQLIELGQAFKSMDSSQLDSYILPGRPQYINGISYWIPDDAQIKPLVDALYEGTTPPAQ
jgi:LCP family protein required for cell wall assembly